MPNSEFPVPTAGEHNDLADNELPVTAIRIAQNIYRNERGRLAMRPGYARLGANSLAAGMMGVGHFRTASRQDKFVVGTLQRLWGYNENSQAWESKTGAVSLTGDFSDHVRFITMETGGVYTEIAMNGV